MPWHQQHLPGAVLERKPLNQIHLPGPLAVVSPSHSKRIFGLPTCKPVEKHRQPLPKTQRRLTTCPDDNGAQINQFICLRFGCVRSHTLGTTRLTKPKERASCAPTDRPVRMRSSARPRPTIRGNRTVPPSTACRGGGRRGIGTGVRYSGDMKSAVTSGDARHMYSMERPNDDKTLP